MTKPQEAIIVPKGAKRCQECELVRVEGEFVRGRGICKTCTKTKKASQEAIERMDEQKLERELAKQKRRIIKELGKMKTPVLNKYGFLNVVNKTLDRAIKMIEKMKS